ncbi:MAG TPA: Xaa-Pro peptidase family protein [Syntrophales bacterium]|nr:Xaa-Pro peptidase family protein [Syntrophales bacterium]
MRNGRAARLMKKTPRDELYTRIRALQMRMERDGMDGALIVQNADLFYFTGSVPQGYLFVPCSGKPILFVRRNIDRIRNESELEEIIAVAGPKELPAILAERGYQGLKRIGMELDVLPVNTYLRYLQVMKPAEIVDIWPSVQALRAVKSDYEIGLLKEVAVLADFIVATCRNNLREGIAEIELAATIEAAARVRGHQGFMRTRAFNQEVYWGHLMSGPDAAALNLVESTTGGYGLSNAFPHGAGWRTIRSREPVICDIGGIMYGYCVDQTRTLAIGSLPDKLDSAYKASLDIHNRLARMIAPGLSVGELFSEGERMAETHNLQNHFLGYGKLRLAFCGHGVGIELDEFPVLLRGGRTILAPGMTIAVEPKFNFPGEGVVGVEDTFVVTEEGSQKLTNASYVVDVTQG